MCVEYCCRELLALCFFPIWIIDLFENTISFNKSITLKLELKLVTENMNSVDF